MLDKEPLDVEEEVEEIEVPEGETDPAAPKVVDLDEEEANDKAFKGLDNKAFAAMRKEASDAKRERDELKKKMAEYDARTAAEAARPPYREVPAAQQREYIGGVPVPQTKAEWDALARQDWQLAVDLRSTVRARAVQEEARAVDTSTRILEETKQKVLAKHPELNDPGSDKARFFNQVIERNPDYLKMPKGPMFAMREMEEAMAEQGFTSEQIFDSRKFKANSEATRANRAALTGGGKMPERQGRTVQLTKEDLEFCKLNELDPKDYAREKLENEARMKGAQL